MDYICAITGAMSDDNAPITDTGPLGWVKVTIERQVPNPEFVELQQLKASMVEQQLDAVRGQLPPDDPSALETVRTGIEFQIRAMFVALESEMDEYVSQMEEAYISTPEMDEDTREALNSMREMLGLMDGVSDTEDQENEQAAESHLKLVDEAEAAPES